MAEEYECIVERQKFTSQTLFGRLQYLIPFITYFF
jgi:hypothetical protein